MSRPTELSAEEVVAKRSGEVLLRHTILKSDHFPGCQNTRLTPLLDGAPNFRQVEGLPVYGVAIPTISGLRMVLDLLGAAKSRRKVLWFNLREEPVLYINGRPFVVREADKPFANLEYTGIDRDRVEDMEGRLKADVLAEAGLYGGMVMVAHEDDSFQVIEEWEAVTEVDVQTPAEVYTELIKDGYDVDYLRVPITDEKAPKGGDFESLISRCWAPPEGSALVFNCQMGRGRTTTGMSIGCLLNLRRTQGVLAPPPPEPRPNLPRWYSAHSELPITPKASFSSLASSSSADLEDQELKNGSFTVIRSLLRALENGRAAKNSLDLVLDACAAMQNLREAIATYRTRLFLEPNEMRRQSILQVCLEYLERYYVLVEFAAYLDDPEFSPDNPANNVSFAEWRDKRPELKGILQRLIRSNPLAALSLDRRGPQESPSSSRAELTGTGTILEEDEEHAEEQLEMVLAHRDGSVLGPHTILKQDHFPGCQSSRLPAFIPGAPNFRGVRGNSIRVFGGAIATAEGVRKVLDEVGAGPEAPPEKRCRAVWHMMREEPVVFICGQPYVLREEGRPFKNLLEYRGIDAERLDQMEQRLSNDVFEEAVKEGGRILVTLETSAPPLRDGEGPLIGHSLRQEYVPVPNPESVVTPKEVFEALQKEGYRVTFIRVPLTDGTCPRPDDFDAFYSAAAAAAPSDALIYTCQLGGGRTTTGMAIGTLLRMHLNGAKLPVASLLERRETFARLDEDVGGHSPRGGSDDDEDGQYNAVHNHHTIFDRVSNHGAALSPRRTSKALAKAINPPVVGTSRPPPHRFLSMVVQNSGESPFANYTGAELMDLETKNLEEGEYVGMRRFTRTLERGSEAKSEVDAVVDACGVLINLRTSIMRYRKPKSVGKFFRPEIQARHSAFQRGSAYLERYCMLVVFAVYLQQCQAKGRSMTFAEWLLARPDVVAAREALHQNPAGALAPVPSVPPLTPSLSIGGPGSASPAVPSSSGKHVSLDEQRQVLLRRKGSTVGRRSILKSFTMAGKHNPLPAGELAVPAALLLEGLIDCRKAEGLPVYTVGQSTVEGLRKLLGSLGARPGGPCHVVITDLREELVLYVNGTAYLRRELEMPAAALHHAGIQAAKLEDLERRLRSDMWSEAASWGGKVLLHREVEHYKKKGGNSGKVSGVAVSTQVGQGQNNNNSISAEGGSKSLLTPVSPTSNTSPTSPTSLSLSPGAATEQAHEGNALRRLAVATGKAVAEFVHHKHGPTPGEGIISGSDGQVALSTGDLSKPDGTGKIKVESPSTGTAASEDGTGTGEGDDITRTTDYQPTTQVAGFWETTGEMGDIDLVSRKKNELTRYFIKIFNFMNQVSSMSFTIVRQAF